MASLATGARRAPMADRGNDLYETPEVATEALVRAENLPHSIWEPACGPGAIARVLRRHGHLVLTTDLVDYGSPDQDLFERDFLLERQLPFGVQAIITNPPFRLASEFVDHALKLCPRVVMLLRLAFLESERRTPILDTGQLARVHVFRNRLPMMHRHGWQGPRASSSVAFAWFCFDRNHQGSAELCRISWSPIEITADAAPAESSARHSSQT